MRCDFSSHQQWGSTDVRIPRSVEESVVRLLFDDARRLDWNSLNVRQRTEHYRRWTSDPQIGGRLREHMSESDARVWIKDGPMKEWTRASNGIGRYAGLIEGSQTVASRVTTKALGHEWLAVPGSLKEKPLRVMVRENEEERILTWGSSSDLKHMVWAALRAAADGDSRDWVVCVTETFTCPVPANEKRAQLRLAKRCNLDLVHIVL